MIERIFIIAAGGLIVLLVVWLAKATYGWVTPSVKNSRLRRQMVRAIQTQWDRYGIWRTTKGIRRRFKAKGGIQHINIEKYRTVLVKRNSTSQNVQMFGFMEVKQPRFAPTLTDFLIASAIERLANKGHIVKLPEAQIEGVSAMFWAGQPVEAKSFTFAYNANPNESKVREEKATEERCCKEIHAWSFTLECPRQRYTFQDREEIDGNVTRYYKQSNLNEEAGDCLRCWEK